MKLKLTVILPLLIVLIARHTDAQTYNLSDFPPYDPQVKTGVLPNGMHYYIRENKLPEKRAEFYLTNNIGAIQENDDQNGLAHFTEHMAFNGTKNFPKKSLINYLGTIGVKFGRNLNAGTGVEQTTFMVTSVPLIRESIIDSVLLILHDWSHYISFDSTEIEAERGVIREEWRMYGSADMRMGIKLAPITYKDSKYAKRDVIGDTAVINNFKHQTIKDFYNTWYRPDLQALVIVGDFNANVVENKIRKLFAEIPAVVNAVPKERYDLPNNDEPLIGTATDPEATSTDVSLMYKAETVKDSERNMGYMRLKILQRMINVMFVQRMAEITRKENPPFLYAYCRYASFTRVKDAFTGTAQARNNESIKALTALLTEMERLKQYGFTQSELDRVKADLLRSYESQYAERDKRKSSELVNANISHFMIRYPNPGIAFEYAFAQQMIPGISLEEINKEVKQYVHPDNMIVTITAPEKEGITVPSVQEIRDAIEQAKHLKTEAYVDSLAGRKLLDKEPVAGKVVKTKTNKVLGTTEWTLSNGAKVVLKPTDFKADEIQMRAWSLGGYSAADDNTIPSAQITDNIAVESGVGNFSKTNLGKMLAGKRVNITPSISDHTESISGYLSPKDFETAMQLVYLYFTQPRWSESDYNTWMDKMRNYFINMKAEPRKAFSDTISVMLNSHSKRYKPTTYELFDEMKFEKVKAFYADRFCDASDFTFLFTGKINPDEVKPLVEKYLASLPVVKRKDVFKDDGVRPPKGKVVNDFSHENKTPRTSVLILYHGKCQYTATDKLYFAAIRHILELRYIESIREEKGGSYHVGVSAQVGNLPEPEFSLSMSFDTNPKLADDLKAIVYREVDKLIANGPSDADLQKAKEYFLKQRQEDLKENNWWHAIAGEYYSTGVDLISGYEENVKNLTTKAIKAYAEKMLTQGNVLEVVMRPEGGGNRQ
jgi:zinc protease